MQPIRRYGFARITVAALAASAVCLAIAQLGFCTHALRQALLGLRRHPDDDTALLRHVVPARVQLPPPQPCTLRSAPDWHSTHPRRRSKAFSSWRVPDPPAS